jgi:hypothetical protein
MYFLIFFTHVLSISYNNMINNFVYYIILNKENYMKKTISTIIKASLVTAGVMGVVTLNAWWCHLCQRDHRGRVCPITGNAQYGCGGYGCGPAYSCWEQEVDSDDEAALMQDIMRR